MRPPTTTTAAVAVLLVALAGLAACGDDGGGEDSTASPTTATAPRATSAPDTTAPEPVRDEEAVLAAVQCYWDVRLAANNPPNPEHPGFEECFTGEALARSRDNASDRLLLGQAVVDRTGAEPELIRILSLDTQQAVVEACMVDDAILIDSATGTELNAEINTVELEIRVVRSPDERWRVEASTLTGSTDGIQPCE